MAESWLHFSSLYSLF
uniref:Uncharacterized protein n=1 Tax=Rhizophora mucronata TaxID=61149 RepID=A0A2P2PUJ2_RHIMU